MGKATIVGGGTGGLYSVRLEYSGLDGQIAAIEARRAALEARIPQMEADLATAENARAQASQAADALIADWIAGLPIADGAGLVPEWSASAMQYATSAGKSLAVPDAILNAISAIQRANWNVVLADMALNAAYADYLSVTTREAELDRLKTSTSATISAWCADYTEDLTGTVATMEVPGEVNPRIGGGINIRPGYFDQAAYSTAYGQLQPATTMSEAGFAWNFTMIQPWLKWRPFWRYGTVTGKDEDNDTLDVSLHPILSKAGAWLAKQTDFNDYVGSSLSAVPVVYMSCGAKVFEIGDEVVVEFRVSGGVPTPFVIGFHDNPKICNIWPEFIYLQLMPDEVVSFSQDICTIPQEYTPGSNVFAITTENDLEGRLQTRNVNITVYSNDGGAVDASSSSGIRRYPYEPLTALTSIPFSGENWDLFYWNAFTFETPPEIYHTNTGFSGWTSPWADLGYSGLTSGMIIQTIGFGKRVQVGNSGGFSCGPFSASAGMSYYYDSADVTPLLLDGGTPVILKHKATEKIKQYVQVQVVFPIDGGRPAAVEDWTTKWTLDNPGNRTFWVQLRRIDDDP